VLRAMVATLCLTVPALAANELPASDVGFGFVVDYATYGDQWPAAMAALGCNTLTIYGHRGTDGTDVAWQVDTALDAGLIDTRFPVLFVPSVTHEEDLLALSRSMRSVGDQTHQPHRRPLTTDQPEHRWPELVGCNVLIPTAADRNSVKALADLYRRGAAIKSGAFVGLAAAEELTDLLNVMILPCAEWDADRAKALRKHSCRPWAWAEFETDDATEQRLSTGLWVFVNRPDVILFAGWQPGSEGEAGFREGVADYRTLRALERKAKKAIDTCAGAEAWAWLRGLTVDGAGDCATVRAKAEWYLQKLNGGG
jgi:hypothetical protein